MSEITMPKSLGQIHTVDFNYEFAPTLTGVSNAFLCDASAELSKQFNRNIRMMQIYKLVGADLVLQLPDQASVEDTDRVICKGRMRYFQPTLGRCQALRDSFEQFKAMAKAQGVNPSNNKLFDFRVIPRPMDQYPHNANPLNGYEIFNTSTLNGVDPLVMTGGATGVSVYDSYNEGVSPKDATVTSDDFTSGLDQWQVGTQTDFVLNEGTIQTGNFRIADTQMEEIPFELAFDITARRVATLQWRPDPALFLGILGGFVEIVIDEAKAEGGDPFSACELDISLHFAGWKSIISPKPNFGKRSRSAKRMRAVGDKLNSKNVRELLSLLAMAKKLK